jgi:hypothetical protein
MRTIRLPRLPTCKSGGSKKSHVIITPSTGNSFSLVNVISAIRKPPSRSQFCRLMESPSIGEAESSPDCAAAIAVRDNVARGDRSLGGESDPETSTIARTIRFASIDLCACPQLWRHVGRCLILICPLRVDMYSTWARASDLVHNSESIVEAQWTNGRLLLRRARKTSQHASVRRTRATPFTRIPDLVMPSTACLLPT